MLVLRCLCFMAVIAALAATPQAVLFAQDRELERGAEREAQEALQSGKDFAREESAEVGPSPAEADLMKAKELDRAGTIKGEERDVEEGEPYRNYPWEE